DGTGPFTYTGLWAVETIHSTATLSIQRVSTACIGSGLCTVSIFPCPASATLAGRALFSAGRAANPNLRISLIWIILSINAFFSFSQLVVFWFD
ncbi:hypothetical protein GYMLUDRAFT_551867, partial [Collybiopsis luxurians FD-317 M1]